MIQSWPSVLFFLCLFLLLLSISAKPIFFKKQKTIGHQHHLGQCKTVLPKMYSNLFSPVELKKLLSMRMSWKLNNVKHSWGYNDALFRVIAKEKKENRADFCDFLRPLMAEERTTRWYAFDGILWVMTAVSCGCFSLFCVPFLCLFEGCVTSTWGCRVQRGNKLVPKRLICSWEKIECIKQFNRMKTVNTKTETHLKSSYFIYAKCFEIISDLLLLIIIFVALSSLVTTQHSTILVPTLLDRREVRGHTLWRKRTTV